MQVTGIDDSFEPAHKHVRLTKQEVAEFYPMALIAVGPCDEDNKYNRIDAGLGSWSQRFYRFRDEYFDVLGKYRISILDQGPGSIQHFRKWIHSGGHHDYLE